MTDEFKFEVVHESESILALVTKAQDLIAEQISQGLEGFRKELLDNGHKPGPIYVELPSGRGQVYSYSCGECHAEARFTIEWRREVMQFVFSSTGTALLFHCPQEGRR